MQKIIAILGSALISLGTLLVGPVHPITKPVEEVKPIIQQIQNNPVQQVVVDQLGGSMLPSDYKITLNQSLTEGGTETSIKLSSVTTAEGHVLTMSDIGSKGYIKLCPTCSNKEIISFTGISSTLRTLTGVVRGYNSYNTATSSANIKSHGQGELVIFSNDMHFFQDNYATLGDQQTMTGAKNISGLFTYSVFPTMNSVTAVATSPDQFVTLYQMNQATSTGGSNASTVIKGVVQEATSAMLQTSSSTGSSGARTYANGASFAQSSTANKVPVANAQGVIDNNYINSSSLFQAFSTSTPTANKIPIANASSSLRGWTLFGGTGIDGALSISSGTTTINLGNASVYTLNYSSISITGTGNLAFSNPNSAGTVVIIKSRGDVAITCSNAPCISLVGIGAAGGIQEANGTNSQWVADNTTTHNGLFGSGGGFGVTGAGGGGGTQLTVDKVSYYTSTSSYLFEHRIKLLAGSGGGGGAQGFGTAYTTGSYGGNGGGALYMEVGGRFNFTTANGISVSGAPGQNGASTGALNQGAWGGGGGGGAGSAVILYNFLTANLGTIATLGGIGGTGGNTTGGGTNGYAGGGGGGGGGNVGGAGGGGGTGQHGANGSNASNGGGVGAGGGGGGGAGVGNSGTSYTGGTGGTSGGSNGYSVVAQNDYF